MFSLSVFTPTYNRAHTLGRVYQSLCEQDHSICRLEWVIIDDGSDDGTADLVALWQREAPFDIRYFYQRNRGMVEAHNAAIPQLSGTLSVCIDSDDYLAPDALVHICNLYRDIATRSEVAGLVGLDVDPTGRVIGECFPPGLVEATFLEIRFRYRIKGDKKYVFKTDVLKAAGRYPHVPNEKFPAVSYLYRKIDKSHKLLVVNIPLCVVEYQPDGNTRRKVDQYFLSPNAFMLFREFCMDSPYDYREKFLSAAHFVASAAVAHKLRRIIEGPHAAWKLLALPLGLAMYAMLAIRRAISRVRQ